MITSDTNSDGFAGTPLAEIEIGPMRDQADALAFRTLNEEWITRHFVLEQKDRVTLGDPHGTIVARGGQVLMVRLNGEPVGCVALIAMNDGRFELSKMAVTPTLRGQGVGRRLILRAVEEARSLGARSLFLGSSTKLGNAVHLYESVGFEHVAAASLPPMKYERADVFMHMDL
ncbi:MAG: hypothetical protein NVSMB62_03410 [Acidobacteriaceae bacterium]